MLVEPCSARGQEVSKLAGAPGIGIPREIIRHWVEFQIFLSQHRPAFSPGADAANRQARAVEGLR